MPYASLPHQLVVRMMWTQNNETKRRWCLCLVATQQGGRFKNSQILTVDIKSKIYRLLGAEEVHHIAPPENDYFTPGPFPLATPFPWPTPPAPMNGGGYPTFPPPSSSAVPYPHHRPMR